MPVPQKSSPKKRKAWLFVPGLLALGLAAGLVLRPAPAPPPVLLHPTPRQFAAAQKHLAVLGKAASAPGTRPRTLRLSESDLNVALAGSPTVKTLLAAHGVRAVQVILQEPDAVVVHAAVTVRGHPQNIQIGGTLAPDPKLGIRFSADSARIGSLPLPAPVVTAEANGLAARFSRQLFSHFSLSVQGVYVQRKDLVIVGLPSAPASPPTASPAHH